MKKQLSAVHGTVMPGFEPVRAAFCENFQRRKELGAACAVYFGSEMAVDLWGGVRDAVTQAPWEEDTMVLVFSSTKGMAALALAVAHSRGLFSYDECVASYWPEFAANGKDSITVAQLLDHQAGLCAIDTPFDAASLADLDYVATAIAAQTRRGGTRRKTWLSRYQSWMVRRGTYSPRRSKEANARAIFRTKSPGRWASNSISACHRTPRRREIAKIKGFHPLEMLLHLHTLPIGFVLAYLNPRSLTARAFRNPALNNLADLDVPEYRAIEMPSSNGIGQARAMARAYGCFAGGGAELGIAVDTMRALKTLAPTPRHGRFDEVLRVETRYSKGMLKPSMLSPFRRRRRGVRHARSRRLVRFRRPGYRSWLRLCDQSNGLLSHRQSTRKSRPRRRLPLHPAASRLT